MAASSAGLRLFGNFRKVLGPARLADLPDYVRAPGLSPDPIPSYTLMGVARAMLCVLSAVSKSPMTGSNRRRTGL